MPSQFAKPTGFIGRIVGWIFANRASNIRRGRWTVDLLKLGPGDRVLEVGCGPGVALKACLEAVSEGFVMGLDHSDVMISQARARNAKAVWKKRLRLMVGTLDDLPVNEPAFDKIFSVNVIQFVDKASFLRTSVARLARGGTLATTYQPRGGTPTRVQAAEMSNALETLYAASGLTEVHCEWLELKPVPVVCVLGRKA